MNIAVHWLRKCLARCGYEARQVSTPTLRLDEFLSASKKMLQGDWELHIFDDDPRAVREISKAQSAGNTFTHNLESPVESSMSRRIPSKPILISVNVERVQLDVLLGIRSWSDSATVVAASGSLGAFNRGICDFAAIERFCAEKGFELLDVASLNQPVLLNSEQTRIFLIFSRPGAFAGYTADASSRVRRVDEARAFLPVPAALASEFKWLTRAGSFGYDAGAFNPGALAAPTGYVAIMRGEGDWWHIQRGNEIKHFSSWRLEWVDMSSTLTMRAHKPVRFVGALPSNGFRVEDFRLLRVGEDIFSNHAVVTLSEGRPAGNQPVRLDSQIVRVGISVVSASRSELQFVGFPAIDIPTRSIEKNWAMFNRGSEVFLIYSMSPYRVLRATSWPKLDFKTVVNRRLSLPIGGASGLIRNSVNPVDYDERHFLHVVHVVHPSKQYVFWALLIEKDSLIPRFVCQIPLVRAGRSLEASIVYLSSIVAEKDHVRLFAGINDCSSGAWEIERSILDARWRKLEE